jgi:hypothetical protein
MTHRPPNLSRRAIGNPYLCIVLWEFGAVFPCKEIFHAHGLRIAAAMAVFFSRTRTCYRGLLIVTQPIEIVSKVEMVVISLAIGGPLLPAGRTDAIE